MSEHPHRWEKADTMAAIPAGKVALTAFSTTAYIITKGHKWGRLTQVGTTAERKKDVIGEVGLLL